MISTTTAGPFVPETSRCRQEQEKWAAIPVKQRLRPARAFRHLLVERSSALCSAVAKDLGKPTDETIAGELLPLAEACRFLEREAARLLRPRKIAFRHTPLLLWGQANSVYRRPRGVVGIIGTWNFPLFLNGVQIVQALTAGNGVLWKPSELGPTSAIVLHCVLLEAGYPEDLMQLLPATRKAGPELAEADIDHVVFTGSSAVGRKLAETLGRRLISSTMELSGCDPLFVLDDADLNLAARAAWFGATVNRGQTCLATRRVFVHQSVYSGYLEALRPLLAQGQSLPLALTSQADQARRLVDEALSEGAKILEPSGPCSRRDEGDVYPPTIVMDARPEMSLCREASFAPILAVVPFENLEAAIRANESSCMYGLGAAIFTANRQRGVMLARLLKAGLVAINDVIVPIGHPATPLGGVRESGWGVTQGAEGLLEMTVPQVVSFRSGRSRPHYDAAVGKPPLSAAGFQAMLQWGHAATLGQRLRGLGAVIRSLRNGQASVTPSITSPDA